MEKQQKTVPEQFGQIAVAFAGIIRDMDRQKGEKTKSNQKKSKKS